MIYTIEYEHEVFLLTAKNSFEADLIIEMLKSEGIPTLKKHKGMGGYLEIVMGTSALGVDIYIPSNSMNQAREVLNNLYVSKENDEAQDLLPNKDENLPNTNMMKYGFMALLLIPSISVILLYLIKIIF